MRLMFILVFLVGIGLAGFATYMARDYITSYQNALAQERAAREQMVPLTDVAVVTKPIRYGDTLTAEDVRMVRWPVDAIPEGAFTSVEALFPQGPENPRTVIRAMETDEAVLEIKVTGVGEDAGVASRLGAGMRAFAFSVDVSSGVSGFLRPGDRVDVYWTGRIRDINGDSQEVTKLILAGVQLIAIDQVADKDINKPTIARTVTVAASSEVIARLAQAQATGDMTLALVGTNDETVASDVEVNQRDLLGIEAPKEVVAEEEQICTIKTRRGADVIEIPIPCTN